MTTQTDHDKDKDIPEFDFSKAQVARHRLRAGLETPHEYEERRAVVNRAIAARSLLDADIEEMGGLAPSLLREFVTNLARNPEFTARLLREIGNSVRDEGLAPGLLRDIQIAMTRLTNESESPALTREAIEEKCTPLKSYLKLRKQILPAYAISGLWQRVKRQSPPRIALSTRW